MSKRKKKEIWWDDDDEQEVISKTQIKQEMKALQELGEAIVKLGKKHFETIPLDDEQLAEAIHTARRIKSREGLRRQLQYIGKLMRKLEEEDLSRIEQAYQKLQDGRKEDARAFQQLEELRDRLIEKGPNQLEEVFEKYPQADRQQLRQLIMQANKEHKANKPPAAARKLFRYLRELSEL
jgi:ribosome-associated protein